MKWLGQWAEEARQMGKEPLAKIYTNCKNNLAKYPLPLDNGLQCKIVRGFGKTVCARLQERLHRHLQQADPVLPPLPSFQLSPIGKSPLRQIHNLGLDGETKSS